MRRLLLAILVGCLIWIPSAVIAANASVVKPCAPEKSKPCDPVLTLIEMLIGDSDFLSGKAEETLKTWPWPASVVQPLRDELKRQLDTPTTAGQSDDKKKGRAIKRLVEVLGELGEAAQVAGSDLALVSRECVDNSAREVAIKALGRLFEQSPILSKWEQIKLQANGMKESADRLNQAYLKTLEQPAPSGAKQELNGAADNLERAADNLKTAAGELENAPEDELGQPTLKCAIRCAASHVKKAAGKCKDAASNIKKEPEVASNVLVAISQAALSVAESQTTKIPAVITALNESMQSKYVNLRCLACEALKSINEKKRLKQ